MLENNQNDAIEWARKPRSLKAWEFLLLLVAEKEPKFIDIMIVHKREGRLVDGLPTKRWDYGSHAWVNL